MVGQTAFVFSSIFAFFWLISLRCWGSIVVPPMQQSISRSFIQDPAKSTGNLTRVSSSCVWRVSVSRKFPVQFTARSLSYISFLCCHYVPHFRTLCFFLLLCYTLTHTCTFSLSLSSAYVRTPRRKSHQTSRISCDLDVGAVTPPTNTEKNAKYIEISSWSKGLKFSEPMCISILINSCCVGNTHEENHLFCKRFMHRERPTISMRNHANFYH